MRSLLVLCFISFIAISCSDNSNVVKSDTDDIKVDSKLSYGLTFDKNVFDSSAVSLEGLNIDRSVTDSFLKKSQQQQAPNCDGVWPTTHHSPQAHNNSGGWVFFTGYGYPISNIIYGFNLFDSNLTCQPLAAYTDRAPSIWWPYIVFKSANGNRFQFANIETSSSLSQIPGARSNTGPTIIEYQNELYVFYKGENNNNIYMVKSSNGGSSWSSTQELFGNTNTIVGATVFRNRIYVFHKGQSSNNIYYRYMTSSGTWSGSHSISGSRSPNTPKVRTNPYENKLYLVYRGEDRKIYFRTLDTSDNWSPQTEATGSGGSGYPGNIRTDSAPDILFTSSQTLITYRNDESGYTNEIDWFILN